MRADVAVETRAPTVGGGDFDRLSDGEWQSTSHRGHDCCPGYFAIIRNHKLGSPTVVKTYCDRGRSPLPFRALTCLGGFSHSRFEPLPDAAHIPHAPVPLFHTCSVWVTV